MIMLILYLSAILPTVGELTPIFLDSQAQTDAIGVRDSKDGSQLDPVPVPQGVTSQGLLAEARSKVVEKKWAEAVVLFRSHLGNDQELPKSVFLRDLPTHLDLVHALMELGRREEALSILERLHDRLVGETRLRNGLRRKIRAISTLFLEDKTFALYQEALLNLSQRKPDVALQLSDRALSREPDHLLLLLIAGQSLILQDQASSAIERLRDAERLDPSNVEVLIWLGRAEMMLGDRKRALRAFEKAFKLGQGIDRFKSEERDALVIWLAEAYVLEGLRSKGLALLEREVGKGRGSLIVTLSWLRTLGLAQMTREKRIVYARQALKRALALSAEAKIGIGRGWLFSMEDLEAESKDWLRALGADT